MALILGGVLADLSSATSTGEAWSGQTDEASSCQRRSTRRSQDHDRCTSGTKCKPCRRANVYNVDGFSVGIAMCEFRDVICGTANRGQRQLVAQSGLPSRFVIRSAFDDAADNLAGDHPHMTRRDWFQSALLTAQVEEALQQS